MAQTTHKGLSTFIFSLKDFCQPSWQDASHNNINILQLHYYGNERGVYLIETFIVIVLFIYFILKESGMLFKQILNTKMKNDRGYFN